MAKGKNTRERILDSSLSLFNREGEPNVSTNHIADEVEISPGNLYYHFRNKEDIVAALYDRLEKTLDGQLVVPQADDPPSLDSLGFYLHLLLETVGKFRFFYRDLVNITTRYQSIQRPFRRLMVREMESLQAICRALRNDGQFRASDEEIARLSQNLVLMMTYWFNFAMLLGQEPDPADAVVRQLGLLTPHFDEAGRLEVMAVAANYR